MFNPVPVDDRVIIDEIPKNLPSSNIQLLNEEDRKSLLTKEQKMSLLNDRGIVHAIGKTQNQVQIGDVVHTSPMAGEPLVIDNKVYRVLQHFEVTAYYTPTDAYRAELKTLQDTYKFSELEKD